MYTAAVQSLHYNCNQKLQKSEQKGMERRMDKNAGIESRGRDWKVVKGKTRREYQTGK